MSKAIEQTFAMQKELTEERFDLMNLISVVKLAESTYHC